MEIEKTNRMNALFEFYAALLTDKQMNYIELYYAYDYSLAEIAEDDIMEKYPDDSYLQEQIAVLSSIDNRD